MNVLKNKKIWIVLLVTVVLSIALFFADLWKEEESIVIRNSYGEGKRTEEYELVIGEREEKETVRIEVEERKYSSEEVQELFEKVSKKLDEVVLGENKSFDRVDQNLNLVTELSDYPVDIQWQLSTYEFVNIEGEIQEDKLSKEGNLLKICGNISYGEEQFIYVRTLMVYPKTRTGIDKILYELEQQLKKTEETTRKEESFLLPSEINGEKIQWLGQKEYHWLYVLVVGVVLAVLLVYRERENKKQAEKRRRDELIREYPGMISKFTMLLGTGTTVKNAWEKIVLNYENQKEQMGRQLVYEEMKSTCNEIQGGVPEAEAYERFGRRCGITIYIKFGTMLAQNLKKGSKGISELLRLEAIQSFENRKSTAKRLGEEAGTKLLMPMLGMLAVVLIMVMVPALLTMQF